MDKIGEVEWICKVCGAKVPEAYSFCTNCGAARQEKTAWLCEKCGNAMPSTSFVFCIYCGARKPAKKDALEPEIKKIVEIPKVTPETKPQNMGLPKISLLEDAAIAKLCPEGYKIVCKIGSGGFSDVFKALDSSNKVVALKFPKIKFLETVSMNIYERIIAEAKVWSKLSERARVEKQQNIVEVYNYGVSPVPWIAIEFMDGGSLDDKLKKGALNLKESLDVALKLSNAIEFAHNHGVVHRDIKPKNILFDVKGNPKITDWGLAMVLIEEVSPPKFFEGTIICAAPEQLDPASFGSVDWRCDIYGFGVTLYWMLTGTPPFKSDNIEKCIEMIKFEEPKPPSEINKALPKELDNIILKLLAKNKKDRYEDIALAKNDIKKLLSKL